MSKEMVKIINNLLWRRARITKILVIILCLASFSYIFISNLGKFSYFLKGIWSRTNVIWVSTEKKIVIEKIEGSGRTDKNAIDSKVSSMRKKREDFWMKTLKTVYPYGLNDRVGDDFMRDQASIWVISLLTYFILNP